MAIKDKKLTRGIRKVISTRCPLCGSNEAKAGIVNGKIRGFCRYCKVNFTIN